MKYVLSEVELTNLIKEINELKTTTRTNWDGCCPDPDYPEIETIDISKKQLLDIILKHVGDDYVDVHTSHDHSNCIYKELTYPEYDNPCKRTLTLNNGDQALPSVNTIYIMSTNPETGEKTYEEFNRKIK